MFETSTSKAADRGGEGEGDARVDAMERARLMLVPDMPSGDAELLRTVDGGGQSALHKTSRI
jgi:hypothetical protein